MKRLGQVLVHRTTRWFLAALGLGFVTVTIARDASAMRPVLDAGWGPALLAFVLVSLASLCASVAWWTFIRGDFALQTGAYLASLVSRYVPGGFAQPVHQLSLASRTPETLGRSSVYLVQHYLVSVASAGLLVIVGGLAVGNLLWLAIGAGALGVGLLCPAPAVLRWAWRLLRRQTDLQPASFPQVLLAAVPTVIGLGSLAASFVVLGGTGLPPFMESGTAYVLAWVLGYVAIAVPGGIGVREGALALVMPAQAAAVMAISLTQRLLGAVSDLGLAFVGAAAIRRAVGRTRTREGERGVDEGARLGRRPRT